MNARNPWPRRFPLSRVRFNTPDAWPDADLKHAGIMECLLSLKSRRLSIPRYHFHLNEDGTITPLMRGHEWELAAWSLTHKTFNLI